MHMTLRSKRAKVFTDSAASSSIQTSNAHINDLPGEMLLKVFSYLGPNQLLNTIPKVCKRWETLHSDPTLYRSLTFTAEGPSTEDALKLLSMAKWLKRLKLHSRTDTNAILECLRTSDQRLETLILRACKGSPERRAVSSIRLFGVLDRCNLLQRLSLNGSHVEDAELYNEIGLRLPSLANVNLGNPRSFDSQAFLNIADNCPDLQVIRAFIRKNSFSITDAIVSTLCNKLKHLHTVATDWHKCSDTAMFSLAACQQLEYLDLRFAGHITDIGILAISDMPELLTLSVCENSQITTEGWLAFLKRPIMRRLQKLELVSCENVNKKAMNMILKNPNDLRELRLLNTKVNCVRSFNPGNQ